MTELEKTSASEFSGKPSEFGNPDSAVSQHLATSKWVQLLELGLVFSPVLIAILVIRTLGIENQIQLMATIWIANVMMLILVWLGIKLRGNTWDSIGLSFRSTNASEIGWALLKSVGILIFALAGFAAGSIVMANIVGIPEGANMTQYNYLSGNLPMLLVSLVGVYFVSSFGEEVVYRGFLITRLQALFGGATRIAIIAAIVVSSIIFGFAHFQWGSMGIGQTTGMGVALGLSFLWNKRRLWPLVLAHGIMDTMLLVPLYFAPANGS